MKYIYVLAVFMSGATCFLNLVWLRFGMPEHYDGAWWKVALSVLTGLLFGALLTEKDNV